MILVPKKRWFLRHALVIVAVSIAPLVTVLFMLINEIRDNGSLGGILIWSIATLLVFAFLLAGITAPAGFHRQIQFDRRTGLMTMRRRPFGFWRPVQVVQSRPMRDIIAIQLLYGGFQCDTIELGGEPGTPGSVLYHNYHSYQLNPVLADAEQTRYNLTTHSDYKWMREAGQKLAGFLGIPLLDQDSSAGQKR
jgi:hypothetical protein